MIYLGERRASLRRLIATLGKTQCAPRPDSAGAAAILAISPKGA